MKNSDWVAWLNQAVGRIQVAKTHLSELTPTENDTREIKAIDGFDLRVRVALAELDPKLSDAYLQAATDIASGERQSWGGISHELREVLRGMIDILAPKEKVTGQSWFIQDAKTSGPTMKQKVRYILDRQGVGSKEEQVTEAAVQMLEMTGKMSRATYDRASDAAHRFKDRREASRILRYLNALAYDLMNLE